MNKQKQWNFVQEKHEIMASSRKLMELGSLYEIKINHTQKACIVFPICEIKWCVCVCVCVRMHACVSRREEKGG